jgi:hypothetical protein
MLTQKKSISTQIPALLWVIFIIVLSVLPGKDIPAFGWGNLFSIDKLVHALFYGLLSWLLLHGEMLRQQRQNDPRTTWHIFGRAFPIVNIVLIFAIALGFGLELVQKYCCADRFFELADALANSVGAFVVWLWYRNKI